MKTKIKRHILKAVTIGILATLIVFSFFYTLLFGLKDTIGILLYLLVPIFIGCSSAYCFGWFITDCLHKRYYFKKWQGVAIIFVLLTLGVITGTISFSLINGNEIDGISEVLGVILIFLVLGSLPTLAVGLWLGKRLKEE